MKVKIKRIDVLEKVVQQPLKDTPSWEKPQYFEFEGEPVEEFKAIENHGTPHWSSGVPTPPAVPEPLNPVQTVTVEEAASMLVAKLNEIIAYLKAQ